jgi:hypothetical protein
MELVFKTGPTTPKSAAVSLTSAEKATVAAGAASIDEFGQLLAGLKSAVVAKPADALTTSTSTAATTSSESSTPSSDASSSDVASASATPAIATTAGYSFTQADQYSPVQMSVQVATANGVRTISSSTATAQQLSLANAMGPVDPGIAAAGGTINDIAVIGPTSYSVIGYQPRASASDPLVPIYGPAPTSYT